MVCDVRFPFLFYHGPVFMHNLRVAVAAFLLVGTGAAIAAEPPRVLPLWPGKAPGETEALPAESSVPLKAGQRPVIRLTNITQPELHFFPAAADKANGTAVVIAPGGGYSILAWDLEGEEVARWLNTIGVTGIVLKYRVPRRPGTPRDQPPTASLMDAQRAISLVRSRAKEWNLKPNRIGMLGFSAGGHLTAWASTQFDNRAYAVVDAADKAACRPDFAVLVYPAYLTPKGKPEVLAPEIRVTADTPPCFFAHAYDDPVPADNSVRMFLELKKLKVPAELHIYTKGGHGFGLRPSADACSTWPARCEAWFQAMGYIASGQK